ncbi:hypothetical protein [Paraburkholderia caffeinilytica]|uniref:hypothetical protein n=1 Tax=Paraburkholderia caffeinilytica TaxID=1761016 RepID=UPI0038B99916
MGISDVSSPVPAKKIAGEAPTHVLAERAASDVLTSIAIGATHPDALADRLLALLVDVDGAGRADVVRGFLRPVAKCIEAGSANAAKATSAK